MAGIDTLVAGRRRGGVAAVAFAVAPPRLLSRDQPPGPPVLDAAGQSAASVLLANGLEAVVAGSGLGRPTVLATDRQFRRFGNLSINPSGRVAFEGAPSAASPSRARG